MLAQLNLASFTAEKCIQLNIEAAKPDQIYSQERLNAFDKHTEPVTIISRDHGLQKFGAP
jgi:hypothetical protein